MIISVIPSDKDFHYGWIWFMVYKLYKPSIIYSQYGTISYYFNSRSWTHHNILKSTAYEPSTGTCLSGDGDVDRVMDRGMEAYILNLDRFETVSYYITWYYSLRLGDDIPQYLISNLTKNQWEDAVMGGVGETCDGSPTKLESMWQILVSSTMSLFASTSFSSPQKTPEFCLLKKAPETNGLSPYVSRRPGWRSKSWRGKMSWRC